MFLSIVRADHEGRGLSKADNSLGDFDPLILLFDGEMCQNYPWHDLNTTHMQRRRVSSALNMKAQPLQMISQERTG